MTIKITIETYNEKSFVVYGEDTKKYKESIKSLGGKWNNHLKNKNDEMFGGWIFSIEKMSEVKDWLKNDCPIIGDNERENVSNQKFTSVNIQKEYIKQLEKKIDLLTEKMECIYKMLYSKDVMDKIEIQKTIKKKVEKPEVVYKVIEKSESDVDSDDVKPKKRLLKK
jgi:hypothetical protein